MTVSYNPQSYIKQNWERTTTNYGKVAIILFHVFIWLAIILSLYQLISPTSQGMACYLAPLDGYPRHLAIFLLRGLYLFLIGFFIYADRGGTRFWNAFMVLVFLLISFIAASRWLNSSDTAIVHACKAPFKFTSWIWIVWIALATVCAFVEDFYGRGGSDEEHQPLNV